MRIEVEGIEAITRLKSPVISHAPSCAFQTRRGAVRQELEPLPRADSRAQRESEGDRGAMGGRKGAPRCRFLSGGNEATHKGIVSEHREESDGSGKDKIRLSVSSTRTNKIKAMSQNNNANIEIYILLSIFC